MSSSSRSAAPGYGLRLVLALFAVYVVWGSTYLAMRWALEGDGFPSFLMVGTRYLVAGAALFAFLLARGARLPSRRDWLHAAPVGCLLFVGGNGLVALGERDIGSGLAAVLVATLPLWMTVIGLVVGERPGRREIVGLAVGILGVLILMSEGELRGAPLATAFLIGASLSWAIGSILARRLTLPAGAMAAALEMIVGGAAAGAIGLVGGERMSGLPGAHALWSMAYLIVAGSWIAFTAYAWLLANTSSAVATSYAFVNPLIAVVLGALLGNETFGWQTAASAPLITLAVALVVTGRGQRPPAASPAVPGGDRRAA